MCGLEHCKNATICNFVYKIFLQVSNFFCPISEMQIQIINYK